MILAFLANGQNKKTTFFMEEKMKKRLVIFMLVLFSILITACASTPKVDEKDIQGYQLPVQPTDSTAVVYVIRPNQTVIGNLAAKYINFELSINDISQVIPNASVVVFILKPGEYTFVAKSENRNEVSLKTEAGKAYFYQVNTKLGWAKGRVATEALDEVYGTYQVKQYYNEETGAVVNLEKVFSSPE